MKRILVIDESEVVRDTLALILGHDFLVVKKALARGESSLYESSPEIDLMILGVAPMFRGETSRLLTFATQAPFAVLFLVDSKSTAKAIEDREQIGCLAKPFNPYELKEKVGQLLARRTIEPAPLAPEPKERVRGEYLEFPYLPRAAATIVPRYAATPFPVLVCGETGCGQDRVARAIADFRAEAGRPVAIECTAVNAQYLAQKRFEVMRQYGSQAEPPLLMIENTERLTATGQSLLLTFLEQVERERGRPQLVVTAKADLLESVYKGDFLETLYARLAILTLKLKPLRERREDLPALAECIARAYAKELGLGEVVFASAAFERLQNYLWFGNVTELEMVLARTLAVRRVARLEAADLVFEFSDLPIAEPAAEESKKSSREPGRGLQLVSAQPKAYSHMAGTSGNGHVQATDLSIMLHELAHELKNPMVTIKTFAQLLSERYQDEDFRRRFEGVVNTDIERMDDLLEALVEFADFMQPQTRVVAFDEILRSVLSEMNDECIKRQVQTRWKENAAKCEVRADEAQLKFVLRNILMAVLSQVKPGTQIEINVEKQGWVSLTFVREMARMAAISQYFATSTPNPAEGILPLRIMLAKHLVERNNGRVLVEDAEEEKTVVRIEFPAQG